MANAATITTLLAQVRSRCDQISSTTYDDEQELKPWVRDSLAQLYEQLVSQWQDWHSTTRPLSLVRGQDLYLLPPDFRAMQAIFMCYNNGTSRTEIKRYNDADSTSDMLCAPLRYRIESNRLRFQTAPSTAAINAVEIKYTPQFRAPLLDYTSIDINLPTGWEEWVVLDVVYKMRMKARLDADYIIAQKQDIERRIAKAAFRRDQQVTQVVDGFRRRYEPWSAPSGNPYWVA